MTEGVEGRFLGQSGLPHEGIEVAPPEVLPAHGPAGLGREDQITRFGPLSPGGVPGVGKGDPFRKVTSAMGFEGSARLGHEVNDATLHLSIPRNGVSAGRGT